MKTLKKLSIILAAGLSTIFFSGCSDYLDVSDDPAAELSMGRSIQQHRLCPTLPPLPYTPGIPDVIKHHHYQFLRSPDRARQSLACCFRRIEKRAKQR